MQIDTPLFACANVGGRMRGTQPLCGQLWTQKGRQMSATCLPIEGLGNSQEEVALSGIVDVLTWRHGPDTSQAPNYPGPGQREVVYPKFLDKLDSILSNGDIGPDPTQSRWPAYEAILIQSMTWLEGSRSIMLPEGDRRLSQ
jgi:hypothetical protein